MMFLMISGLSFENETCFWHAVAVWGRAVRQKLPRMTDGCLAHPGFKFGQRFSD